MLKYSDLYILQLQRNELLENLSNVQVKSNELAMFDSIAHLGTRNSKLTSLSKRPVSEELQTAINDTATADTISNLAGLKGWTGRRKRRKLLEKVYLKPYEIKSFVYDVCDYCSLSL